MRPNLSSIRSKGSNLGSSLEAKTTNLLGPRSNFRAFTVLLVVNENGQMGFRLGKKKEEVAAPAEVVATERAKPPIFSEIYELLCSSDGVKAHWANLVYLKIGN